MFETPFNYLVHTYWSRSPTNRPSWSSDGRTIALGSITLDGEQDYSSVLLVDVATGHRTEIGRMDQPSLGQPEINEVAWLDDRRLLVSRDTPGREGDYSLWVLDVRTQAYHPVTGDLAGYEGVSTSAKRSRVVATRVSPGPQGVWTGDLGGAPERRVIEESLSRPYVGGVSARGDVYFTAATAEGHRIRVLDRDGVEPRTLGSGRAARLAPGEDVMIFVSVGPDRG